MKKLLALLALTFALAVPAASTAGVPPQPSMICGSICFGGSLLPPCPSATVQYGTVIRVNSTDNPNRWDYFKCTTGGWVYTGSN